MRAQTSIRVPRAVAIPGWVLLALISTAAVAPAPRTETPPASATATPTGAPVHDDASTTPTLGAGEARRLNAWIDEYLSLYLRREEHRRDIRNVQDALRENLDERAGEPVNPLRSRRIRALMRRLHDMMRRQNDIDQELDVLRRRLTRERSAARWLLDRRDPPERRPPPAPRGPGPGPGPGRRFSPDPKAMAAAMAHLKMLLAPPPEPDDALTTGVALRRFVGRMLWDLDERLNAVETELDLLGAMVADEDSAVGLSLEFLDLLFQENQAGEEQKEDDDG